jgi:hypothetical protein
MKTCSRAGGRYIDAIKEVHIIAKSIMKDIGSMRPANKDLWFITERFIKYQVGNKDYYELLAIELAKHLDQIDFKSKCDTLHHLAQADIDSQFIYKTAHNLCSAYTEAITLK